MANICVTGASGRAGRAVVAELLEHGHQVVATDLVVPSKDLGVPVLRADLTDYGQAAEVLQGTDAGGHLANIPAPGLRTPAGTVNWNNPMKHHAFRPPAQLRRAWGAWIA